MSVPESGSRHIRRVPALNHAGGRGNALRERTGNPSEVSISFIKNSDGWTWRGTSGDAIPCAIPLQVQVFADRLISASHFFLVESFSS